MIAFEIYDAVYSKIFFLLYDRFLGSRPRDSKTAVAERTQKAPQPQIHLGIIRKWVKGTSQ